MYVTNMCNMTSRRTSTCTLGGEVSESAQLMDTGSGVEPPALVEELGKWVFPG